MARGDNKVRFYAEPPLSHALGKDDWLATAIALLAGVLCWPLAGWHWAIQGAGIVLAVIGWRCWRKYQQLARRPTEGECDAQGQRHGRWVWRFPSGAVGREADYHHGLLHGRSVEYFPDGKLYQEAHFENGELFGTLRQWDREGALDFEADLRANLVHGRYVVYYVDGTKDEWTFDSGEPHGRQLAYGADGKLREERFCDRGQLHGLARSWHPNGRLAEETTYVQGVCEGLSASWFPDGTPKSTGAFVDGQRHGVFTWWHPNGERRMRCQYQWDALHGPAIEWTPDGAESQSSEFVAGYECGSASKPFEVATPDDKPPRSRWLFRGFLILFVAAAIRDAYFIVPVVILLITIGIHELGHLLAAKAVGIPIRRFRVGLGPVWCRRLHRGTVYEWSAIPVLGFVEEYALRESEWVYARAVLAARHNGQREPDYPAIDPKEPQTPGAQLVAPPKRLVYLLAGVTFNLLAAWLAAWGSFAAEPARPDAPPSFVASCQMMGEASKGVFVAIFEDLATYTRLETYTTYQPSLFAMVSEKSREFSAQAQSELSRAWEDEGDPETASEVGAEEKEPYTPGFAEVILHYARGMLVLVFAIQFGVAVFNLLPLPPLDGYQCVATIFEAVLGRWAHFVLRPLSIVGILLLAFLLLVHCFFIVRDLVMAVFW